MARQPEPVETWKPQAFVCTACGDIVPLGDGANDRHGRGCRPIDWTHEKRLRALANVTNRKEDWDNVRNEANAASARSAMHS